MVQKFRIKEITYRKIEFFEVISKLRRMKVDKKNQED